MVAVVTLAEDERAPNYHSAIGCASRAAAAGRPPLGAATTVSVSQHASEGSSNLENNLLPTHIDRRQRD